MKKHTKIYLNYFNYGLEDFIPCEICGSKAVDIHHIESRGMGGSRNADTIENLMAVCRPCHLKYGDVKEDKEWLKDIHKKRMQR
jgi:5-methylcytosine-specific restriction endonuclease McrA|tara:strand:+ start:749 stop:1000 length:252 start_codon:yes stop_codon:yes gene_type:complete